MDYAGLAQDLSGSRHLEGKLPRITEIPDPALRPTIPVREAFALLGTSAPTGYEQIRQGNFPVPVLRLGRSLKVPTAPLLELLGLRPGISARRPDDQSEPATQPESGETRERSPPIAAGQDTFPRSAA